MSSFKILFSITLLVACLGFTEAIAQCPTGWTAVGPVNVTIPCGVDSITVQVWYCYLNPSAGDTTCKIQLSKVCGVCPGMSDAAVFDAVIDVLALTNQLNLDAGNQFDCLHGFHQWTFSRPMCTWRPTGCVEVCGNTTWKCTKTYDVCYDFYTSSWSVTLSSTAATGASSGPCAGSCTTGTCP